jgi:hypothetical protein
VAQYRRPLFAPRPLTPQQVEYRNAVKALGIDKHHFVHVELLSGKVRTGAIVHIGESEFRLRDGILANREISYAELKEPPRYVPAIGTHIADGLKWTGTAVGMGVFLVLTAPLLVLCRFSCT